MAIFGLRKPFAVGFLQLLGGLVSSAFYTLVQITVIRFFPFQILTDDGTRVIDWKDPVFTAELHIIVGSQMSAAALLFLGHETFCLSKKAEDVGLPAHHIFGSVRLSMLIVLIMNGIAMAGSSVGFVTAIQSYSTATYGECLSFTAVEDSCAVKPAVLADLPTCFEQNVQYTISAVYTFSYLYNILVTGPMVFFSWVKYSDDLAG